MFRWKKKTQKTEKKYPVETIPEIFYGGNDPQVYHPSELQATEDKQKMMPKTVPKKSKPKIEKSSSGGNFGNRPKWQKIVALSLVSVLAVGAISWYYLRQYFGTAPAAEITAQPEQTITAGEVEQPETVESTAETPTSTQEPTEEEKTPQSESLATAPLDFPKVNQLDSPDLDSDGLTDLEEELFNTDSGTWDTDGDGYYDGLEVINLYSPEGFTPSRIIDSGLVQEYINNNLKYRFFYPTGWEIGQVDTEGRQILISSITGDFIELRVFELNTGQMFTSWFAQNAKDQKFLDLENYTNRFKETGYKRKDGLVVYFVSDQLVYTIIYHPGTLNEIPYRYVMDMLVASFRPDQTIVEIPEQEILSEPPTNTEIIQEIPTEETVTSTG